MIFSNLFFQLHPIITLLILDQLACSLPKTNTTFHQLFKYATKDATFSSIRWENSKNIFGQLYLRSTVHIFWVSLYSQVSAFCNVSQKSIRLELFSHLWQGCNGKNIMRFNDCLRVAETNQSQASNRFFLAQSSPAF